MKGAGKILFCFVIVTSFFMGYVHGQISLFRVSYSIDKLQRQESKSREEYRHLKFEIDQLRAPQRLEEKIKQLQFDLTLPKEVRVIQVRTHPAPETAAPMTSIEEMSLQPFSKNVFGLFGHWIKVAQAKTDN